MLKMNRKFKRRIKFNMNIHEWVIFVCTVGIGVIFACMFMYGVLRYIIN